jgi:hypothetical protein
LSLVIFGYVSYHQIHLSVLGLQVVAFGLLFFFWLVVADLNVLVGAGVPLYVDRPS